MADGVKCLPKIQEDCTNKKVFIQQTFYLLYKDTVSFLGGMVSSKTKLHWVEWGHKFGSPLLSNFGHTRENRMGL